jgi:hypothetical protein
MAESPYLELARTSTHDVAIGGALISMVEPHPGTERAYNRWYEDDHFYAGALFMPWMFAGGRFVATRDLQLLRYPDDSVIAQPVTAGCYLHLYWITQGHVEDHVRWSVGTNQVLRREGRIHLERDHVFTSFQDYLGAVSRDETGPRDFHSLDVGYPAVVMEVVDARPEVGRDAFDAWLTAEYLPRIQGQPHSPIAQTLRFTPQPLPEDKMPDVADIPGLEHRITLIHLLDADPRLHWMTGFARDGQRIADGGLGHMQLCAPFVAVDHGTDRYVDELRDPD